MREIKFRAWDKIRNIMYPNCSPIQQVDGSFQLYQAGYRKVGEYEGGICVNTQFEISDFRVMQYTGLKDKNGKEIYEGDLIEYMRAGKKVRHVVEYDSWQAGFRWVCQNQHDNEIIGNIYQNPELLRTDEPRSQDEKNVMQKGE